MEKSDDSLEPAGFPNDAFFKEIFSQPEHATAFFQSYLPPAIAAWVDWPTLKALPASFVKANLKQVHADLLFAAQLRGRETLFYLLFEHQSTVDSVMPLRMLGYVTEILLHRQKSHCLPLPPVLPFVFHQGPDRWNISTAFEDLFELPDDLATELLPFLPKFHHALLDLTRYDPAHDENQSHLQLILQLMKLTRERQVLRYFQWLAQSTGTTIPESLLRRLLLYALHADSDLDTEKIYHTLASNPELRKTTMSLAEKLIAQGRTVGHWVGRIQSLEEFLDKPQTSQETLEAKTLAELEALHQQLHGEYERRFKQS